MLSAAIAQMGKTTQPTHGGAKGGDELFAELDEEPDERKLYTYQPIDPAPDSSFTKSRPTPFGRRESLLTRQLHASETDSHTEDEHHVPSYARGMSTCSNPSIASTAELTSDNELTSPITRDSSPSPPPPPHHLTGRHMMSAMNKSLVEAPIVEEPVILEHGDDQSQNINPTPEKQVEAGLGRRRCITFACGRRSTSPKIETLQEPAPAQVEAPQAAPLKRKCMLTFACPSKPKEPSITVQEQPVAASEPSPAAAVSAGLAPSSPRLSAKVHRGSDSTIKTESPKSYRKISMSLHRRKYSRDVDDKDAEAARFHEFGATVSVEEEWIREATCHRSRLTVNDTLQKENAIRKLGEEAEEEALEEFDDDRDLDEDEENDVDDDDDDDDDEVDEVDDDADADVDVEIETVQGGDDVVSDAGFDTDDEDGFAVSDSESEGSDTEWWAPGRSTAATSTEHLDIVRPSRLRTMSDSSLESARDANGAAGKARPKRKAQAVVTHRPGTPDLPDSTDFVCGTLDEDRPLEAAYLSCKEQRKAAKAKVTPQDIDPTFPTSDLEMDEEDEDEEEEELDESDANFFMHGNIDLNHDEPTRRGRKTSSPPPRKKSPAHSPRRMRSPPPPVRRATLRSPPPDPKRAHRPKSPAPEPKRAQRARSPAPVRRLFGQSPKRHPSPAPLNRVRMTSPPPSRRTSMEGSPTYALGFAANTLAQRPQPTHTASLPRRAALNMIKHPRCSVREGEEDDTEVQELRSRGAIDIVKGLEKKRQRRKEKLYQKQCQKAGKDRSERNDRKPKPGKGAERMREVGLELAAYKGKKEHMLSY